jgi:DNA polymerase III delta subunit
MKKTDLALKVARLILNESTSLFPLLRGLRNQLQVELQVACLLNESSSALQEIQNLFPYMKGKILQNHVQIAQNFGLSNLKKAIMIVDEIDFLAKSGSVDEDLLLDMLIAKVTYV